MGERASVGPREPHTMPVTGYAIAPLADGEFEEVIELDRVTSGASRRGFFSKRRHAMAREPAAFAGVVARERGGIAGFALASIHDGEFGGAERSAVLDALAVAPERQGAGIGRGLLDALIGEVGQRGVQELRTQAEWRRPGLLEFFNHVGFVPAPRLVLERVTDDAVFDRQYPPQGDAKTASGGMETEPEGGAGERDYGRHGGPDFEALPTDRVSVRSMAEDDVAQIVRIDRRITGRDRRAYLERKATRALRESGVRLSLVAEPDDRVVGFVMARVDYGEFGRTDTVAVIDTIGVDPSERGRSVGRALMSQLLRNLGSLRVETVHTEVEWQDFSLNRFLWRCGFVPAQRLALSLKLG